MWKSKKKNVLPIAHIVILAAPPPKTIRKSVYLQQSIICHWDHLRFHFKLHFTFWNCFLVMAETPPKMELYGNLKTSGFFCMKKNPFLVSRFRKTHLNPMVSTATDMCLGWSGQLYKFRSSMGSKSMSWNMKQSQSPSFCDSTKPTFMSAARLNNPSVTCSITKIPYSICCFIRNGWMLARKIGKCCGRSRYGMMIATRSLALHSFGLYQPPGRNFPTKWDSITFISSSVVFTLMLPTENKEANWNIWHWVDITRHTPT